MGRRTLLALATVVIGAGAQAQTPIPPSPKDFLMATAASDQYEITAAAVALTESKDARVRVFAQAMIDDHERLGRDLRAAAAKSGLPEPPAALSGDGARWLASLQGVRGAEFDKAYATQQILAHAQAAAVEESFATGGADPNLQAAARAALPTVRDHLAKARELHGLIVAP